MKRIIPYIVIGALLTALVYVYINNERKSLREAEISSQRVNELKNIIQILESRNDSLIVKAVRIESDMSELEEKADSLGEIVESLDLPCEHELELKREEVVLVREALDKCKEAKAIQTTRIGICETIIENKVELCGEMIQIEQKDIKKQKRKSFLKGMGVGGTIVAILIILAL